MSYEPVQISLVNHNVIRADHPSLPTSPVTYLTSSVSAADVTLTVRDNFGFANSDLVLIGKYGDSRSEIKRINVAPNAGTTIGCVAVSFAHSVNVPVQKILFDKVVILGNSTATSDGATTIATIDITPGADYTEYVNTGTTYNFYGVRLIRQAATAYDGSFSDFIPAAGFGTDTVGFVIQRAFETTGEKLKSSGVLSKQWAYDQIFLCEQDVSKELKKWSWLQEFEYDAGNIALGVNSYALPTNISDPNTPKAIQGLRIGTGDSLTYISKAEYESLFQNVAGTTIALTYADSATTIGLADSRDFASSTGSINVYTSDTIDTISYTTNARSSGVLSGVTAVAVAGTAGDPVWQNENPGLPERYTVYEGNLYFEAIPDDTTDLVGSNIWLDYYKKVTRVNSDGDTLSVPDPLLVQNWLEVEIKKAKNGGKVAPDDSSYVEFLGRKKRLKELEVSGQSTNFVPEFYEDIDIS